MDAVVGQWRATYTPGDWVLLSGPTSMVLLEPPGPESQGMISLLWDEVVASSSMTELAGRLAGYPLDTLPSFAAFFWTDDGMRSLVRGGVSVVDLTTGTTVADGEGIQTWTEVGLGQIDQVLVETQAGEGTRLELPLVVGAVRAASVRLDASAAARVRSPQVAPPLVGPIAYAEAAPEPAYAAASPPELEPEPERDQPPEEDQPAEAAYDEGGLGGPDAAWGGPAVEIDPTVPAVELSAPAVAGELSGPSTEPLDDPFDDSGESATVREHEPWMSEPELDPVPARALAEGGTELENADTQQMSPPYGTPDSPSTETMSGVSQNSLIMAVVCQYGHTSAQNATTCRICGSPIAPQGPQLLPRPVLAVLRASDGSSADVDRAVLVGRAPSGQRSSARAPRLMTVPSPGHDISRTHLEVAPEGWSVVITDLHSTNGTLLVRPDGGERQQLPPGQAVAVQLGSVIELGDGISVLVDFPQ